MAWEKLKRAAAARLSKRAAAGDCRPRYAPLNQRETHFAEPLEPRLLFAAQKISDLAPSPYASPTTFASDGVHAFFTQQAARQSTIFETDGTTDGTREIGSVESAYVSDFTVVDGRLFFEARPLGTYQTALYTVAPGSSTIERLKLFDTLDAFEDQSSIIGFNHRAYIVGREGQGPLALYATDGTAAGTVIVSELNAQPGQNPSGIGRVGDQLYMATTTRLDQSWILYRSDGTSAGTQFVAFEFSAKYNPSPATHFVAAGSHAVFLDPYDSHIIWTTDGTSEGTQKLNLSAGGELHSSGSYAYFPLYDQLGASAITDGTQAGTRGFEPLNGTSRFFESNGKLFAAGSTSDHPEGVLWRVEGQAVTPIAYFPVSSVIDVGGRDYFTFSDDSPIRYPVGVTTGMPAEAVALDSGDAHRTGDLIPIEDSVLFAKSDGLYRLGSDALPLPSVFGNLFSDRNQDGIQQADEPDLVGTAQGGGVQDDSISGKFALRWLSAGPTDVFATPQFSPFRATTTRTLHFDLVEGQNVQGVKFGFVPLHRVSGQVILNSLQSGVLYPGQTVFADIDRDGVLDPGEPSAQTDASGYYTIDLIPGDDFFIRAVRPAGVYPSYPQANGYLIHTMADQSGQSTDLYFGFSDYPPPRYVSFKTFEDLNHNGEADSGEPPLDLIVSIDINNDGLISPGEPSSQTVNGASTVLSLPNGGPFPVKIASVKQGWQPTRPLPVLDLPLGESLYEIPIGVDVPAPSGATIAGNVFADANADGVRDPGETGARDVLVYLDLDRDYVLDFDEPRISTDSGGQFSFVDLAPGQYAVRQNVSGNSVYQSAPAPGASIEVDLQADQQRRDLLFGRAAVPPGGLRKITGTLFDDVNLNGVRDPDEPALTASTPIPIYLDLNNDGQRSTSEPMATPLPGASTFTLNGVAPGRYHLRTAFDPRVLSVATPLPDGSIIVDVPVGSDVNVPVGLRLDDFEVKDVYVLGYASGFDGIFVDFTGYVDFKSIENAISFFDDAGNLLGPDPVSETVQGGGYFSPFPRIETRLFRRHFQYGKHYTLVISGAALKVAPGQPAPKDIVFEFDYLALNPSLKTRSLYYGGLNGQVPSVAQLSGLPLVPDKTALLPGEAASFANVSSYAKGINGVVIDIAGTLGPHADLQPSDFNLRAGAGDNPARCADVSQNVTVTTLGGAGVGGSVRVLLTWPDGTLVNTWLGVTVKATPRTGLRSDDTFYFGNLVGDTGDAGPGLSVDAADLVRVRNAVGTAADLQSPFDFDRNGVVNATDLVRVRNNVGHSISRLSELATAVLKQPRLAPESDTGRSATDRLTKFNNASVESTLTFIVDGTVAGAEVLIYADGTLVGRAASVSGSTRVTTDGVTALADGPHNFEARQVSNDGRYTIVSPTLLVTTDATPPPPPPALDLYVGSDLGPSNTDNITSAEDIFLQIYSGFHQFYRDGVAITGLSAPEPFSVGTRGLADGPHEYQVANVDDAGNISSLSDPLIVTIDHTPPVQETSAADILQYGGADYTFTVTYSDNLGLPADVGLLGLTVLAPSGEYLVALPTSLAGEAGALSRTVTYRLLAPGGTWDRADAGQYKILAQDRSITDVAGNYLSFGAYFATFLVNPTGIPPIDLMPETDSGVSQTDNLTNFNNHDTASAPAFVVNNTQPGTALRLYADDVLFGTTTVTDFVTTIRGDGATRLADGFHRIRVEATSASGGPDEVSANLSIRIDTIAQRPDAPTVQRNPGVGGGIIINAIAPNERGVLHISLDGQEDPELTRRVGASDFVSITLFGGTSTYAAASSFNVPSGISPKFTIGDFNNDGLQDIYLYHLESNTSELYVGLGNGGFIRVATPPFTGWQLFVSDVTGDDTPDVISIGRSVEVFRGLNDGRYLLTNSPSVLASADFKAALGDINGDGHADLVVGAPSGFTVMLGDGQGHFDPLPSFVREAPGRATIKIADMDGDGIADLVIGFEVSGGASGPAIVNIYKGNGDGTFTINYIRGLPPNNSIIDTADVNGDGRADLTSLETSDPLGGVGVGVAIYFNDGSGRLQDPVRLRTPIPPTSLEVRDVNRDGKPDIVTSYSVSLNGRVSSTLAVFSGMGDGTFRPVRESSLGVGAEQSALADFDGNGTLDLFVLQPPSPQTGLQTITVFAGADGLLPTGQHAVYAWFEDLAGNRSEWSDAVFTPV